MTAPKIPHPKIPQFAGQHARLNFLKRHIARQISGSCGRGREGVGS